MGGFILPQSKVSPSQEVTVTVTLHCIRKVLEGISPQYFFKDVGKTPSQVSLKLFPHSISPGITSQYLCRSLSSQYLSKYFTSHSISLEVFPHSISQSILFGSIPLERIFYLAVSLWKYSLTVSLKVFYLEVSLLKVYFTSQYLSGSIPSQYLSKYFISKYLSGSIPSQYLSGSIPSQYLSKYFISKYLSGSIPSQYLSGSITSQYLSGSITSQYLSSYFTSQYLSGSTPSQYTALQLCKYSFTLQTSFSQYCLKRLASHILFFPVFPQYISKYFVTVSLTSKIFRYFSQNMKLHPSNLFHFSLKTKTAVSVHVLKNMPASI